MDAKLKAKELIDKFLSVTNTYGDGRRDDLEVAKECALIAVDEIIEVLRKKDNALTYLHQEILFYEKVKQEIINQK